MNETDIIRLQHILDASKQAMVFALLSETCNPVIIIFDRH